jgi:hypothetical protein
MSANPWSEVVLFGAQPHLPLSTKLSDALGERQMNRHVRAGGETCGVLRINFAHRSSG